MLPGFSSPAAGFEQPFEMLDACHDRVRRSLRRLQRLAGYLREHGCDTPAREAAADVLRYFDVAAPHHHEDEERHVFPPLLGHGTPALQDAVRRLQRDHVEMAATWQALRPALQAVADGRSTALDAGAQAHLQHFVGLYDEHLRIEDETVYPAARACIGDAALAAIGDDMAQRRGAPPPRRPGPCVSGARD